MCPCSAWCDTSGAKVAPSVQPGTVLGDGQPSLPGSAALRGTRGPRGVQHPGPGKLVNSSCPFNNSSLAFGGLIDQMPGSGRVHKCVFRLPRLRHQLKP